MNSSEARASSVEKEVIYIAEREDLITYIMINQSVVLQEEMICVCPHNLLCG